MNTDQQQRPFANIDETELQQRRASIMHSVIQGETAISYWNKELTAIRIELATRRIEERKQEAEQVGEGVTNA